MNDVAHAAIALRETFHARVAKTSNDFVLQSQLQGLGPQIQKFLALALQALLGRRAAQRGPKAAQGRCRTG